MQNTTYGKEMNRICSALVLGYSVRDNGHAWPGYVECQPARWPGARFFSGIERACGRSL